MEANMKIEKRNKEKNISLYKSALFCSLVSICRYVKINKINYLFTKDVVVPDIDGHMKFTETEDDIYFVDHIASRIVNYDWYKNLRKGGALNNQDTHVEDSLRYVKNLKGNEKVVIYQSNKAIGYCSVTKNTKYDSYVFKGPSSKNLLKKFMELNQEYKVLTQILDDRYFKRQFVPFLSWNDCFEKHNDVEFNKRYVYEIISSDKPSKPYLDIEWISNNKDLDLDKFVDNIKQNIINIFANRYKKNISKDDIYVSKSHLNNKISFHIVINAVCDGKLLLFSTNKKQNQNSSWDLCQELLKLHDIELNKNKLENNLNVNMNNLYKGKIDDRVYTYDREFRTIYSNKDGKDKRPFLPLEQNTDDQTIIENWKKYLVSDYDGEYELIQTPFVNIQNVYQKRVFIDLKQK
jgi:hypothetical protein